jgi:hypothetical protein
MPLARFGAEYMKMNASLQGPFNRLLKKSRHTWGISN